MAEAVGTEFRFIYLIRNPINRIQSQYNYDLPAGRIPPEYVSRSCQEIFPPCLYISSYAMQISEYDSRFGRESSLLVLFEDFVENPKAELQRICNFLEIDSNFVFSDQVDRNATRGGTRTKYPLWLYRLKWGRRSTILQLLLPVLRRFRSFAPKSNSLNIELTAEQKKYALDWLRPDILRLRDEFGIQVEKWQLPIES
ncbi:MAG: sulfotransferase domain-containing protein [Anaerolineae bacterium]|nr:sulfotransferase domain-containing protein [Anaerolineae bacterium]